MVTYHCGPLTLLETLNPLGPLFPSYLSHSSFSTSFLAPLPPPTFVGHCLSSFYKLSMTNLITPIISMNSCMLMAHKFLSSVQTSPLNFRLFSSTACKATLSWCPTDTSFSTYLKVNSIFPQILFLFCALSLCTRHAPTLTPCHPPETPGSRLRVLPPSSSTSALLLLCAASVQGGTVFLVTLKSFLSLSSHLSDWILWVPAPCSSSKKILLFIPNNNNEAFITFHLDQYRGLLLSLYDSGPFLSQCQLR